MPLSPSPVGADSASPESRDERFSALFRRLVSYFTYKNYEGHTDVARDLAQETLARLLQRMADGETIVEPSRFCWGVARHVASEHRRGLWRAKAVALDDSHDSPPREQHNVEVRVTLTRLLKQLPEEDRRILVQYYLHDRAALRKRTGLSEGALRLRVHRIRRQLLSSSHWS